MVGKTKKVNTKIPAEMIAEIHHSALKATAIKDGLFLDLVGFLAMARILHQNIELATSRWTNCLKGTGNINDGMRDNQLDIFKTAYPRCEFLTKNDNTQFAQNRNGLDNWVNYLGRWTFTQTDQLMVVFVLVNIPYYF